MSARLIEFPADRIAVVRAEAPQRWVPSPSNDNANRVRPRVTNRSAVLAWIGFGVVCLYLGVFG